MTLVVKKWSFLIEISGVYLGNIGVYLKKIREE
jgi:hypothetical protein